MYGSPVAIMVNGVAAVTQKSRDVLLWVRAVAAVTQVPESTTEGGRRASFFVEEAPDF